jgi:hypothetical protein
METQWTPIGQSQPVPGQTVLVFESSNRQYNAPLVDTMRVAFYQGREGFSYADARGVQHQALNVTHWMPLPSPPEM